jgi:prepilin-type processing-associated H-X9-DG protein
MYTQDYDNVLPPMKDAATVKKALLPYVKNDAVFAHPGTKEPYAPNPILSGRKMAHIANSVEMVALYEATPAPDGKRGVVFVDGHAKRVQEEEWARLKRASKLR